MSAKGEAGEIRLAWSAAPAVGTQSVTARWRELRRLDRPSLRTALLSLHAAGQEVALALVLPHLTPDADLRAVAAEIWALTRHGGETWTPLIDALVAEGWLDGEEVAAGVARAVGSWSPERCARDLPRLLAASDVERVWRAAVGAAVLVTPEVERMILAEGQGLIELARRSAPERVGALATLARLGIEGAVTDEHGEPLPAGVSQRRWDLALGLAQRSEGLDAEMRERVRRNIERDIDAPQAWAIAVHDRGAGATDIDALLDQRRWEGRRGAEVAPLVRALLGHPALTGEQRRLLLTEVAAAPSVASEIIGAEGLAGTPDLQAVAEAPGLVGMVGVLLAYASGAGIGVWRALAEHPLLQRPDGAVVRRALAEVEGARRDPMVRRVLRESGNAGIWVELLRDRDPAEWLELWPRLVASDPSAALDALERTEPVPEVAVDPRALLPLLRHDDRERRLRAQRALGRWPSLAATTPPPGTGKARGRRP